MDQAPNHPGSSDAPPDAPAPTPAAVSPATAGWDEYYRAASRRRRRNGGDQQFRIEKRRRRIRERLAVVLSALFVGAMTAVFYLVLR
jgi:hypothetical protein